MITPEYGKITGWWNKKNITGIDLWDVVEVLLSRDTHKNTIKNMEVTVSWWNRNWDYLRIVSFLETLRIITKISVDGHECRSLYDDTYLFIAYGHRASMNVYHYSIFQMRILKALGSMDPAVLWDDSIMHSIYEHISHTPLERILSSSKIKWEHITKIQQINLHSIYMLDR